MSMVAAEQIPQARIIERMPFEKYVGIQDALHATALKDMLVSPLLYDWRRRNKREDTDTLRVGRAAHTAILEPDRFLLEYTVWRNHSDGKTRKRQGAAWDEFKAANRDKTILTESQYGDALAMRDAVRAHAAARRLLDERGKCELTIHWTHARTGMPCVSRLDYLCSAIVDLKTTRNTAPAKFAADCARFGYDLQAGFYGDAAAVAGLGALPFKFLAVQKVPPYDVAVFNVPEDVMTVGRAKYEDAIDKVIACRESKSWPGASPDEEELRLPAWATPEEELQLTFGGEAL
jgi:hypothetical protein